MKNLTGWAALLLAAMTLNSCSQDAELEAAQETSATTGALTPEQKAQIMELAEYYDLDVTIDETRRTRGSEQEFNIDSLDAEFRRVAALKGEYKCVQTDSATAIFQKETVASARPERITRMMGETTSGEFRDDKNVFGYWMTFTVSWKWGIEIPGKVDVDVEAYSCPYEVVPKISSYTFMGMQPGFTFSGELHLISRDSGKILFRLRLSGSYFNGRGDVYVG